MRLITYNVHQGLDRAGRPIAEALAAAIAARRPDVVACQEVLRRAADGRVDVSRHIAAALLPRGPAAHRFAPNCTDRRGVIGNALVVLRTLREHRNVDLSTRFAEPRGLQTASIEPHGISVWNTHLGLTSCQRRRQWATLRARLRMSRVDTPLVLCGDFNSWSGGIGRAARRADLRDALEHLGRSARRTFPAHRPLLALDRIWYRGLRLVDARVLHGSPWTELSDHLPVEADFAPLTHPERIP